jgi:hypothetical protein
MIKDYKSKGLPPPRQNIGNSIMADDGKIYTVRQLYEPLIEKGKGGKNLGRYFWYLDSQMKKAQTTATTARIAQDVANTAQQIADAAQKVSDDAQRKLSKQIQDLTTANKKQLLKYLWKHSADQLRDCAINLSNK